MKFTRREFVKTTAAGTAAMLLYKGQILRSAYAYGYSPALQKFIQPMPLFGAGIPLATPHSTQPFMGVDYYKLTAGVFTQQLHPALPNPTRLYGYASSGSAFSHLGGAIIAQKGRPVRFNFKSQLPSSHILPYDTSVVDGGNGGARQDKATIHLHGGLVPWTSDGGPFHWQTNPAKKNGGLMYGASVIPWLWDGNSKNLKPNKWEYYYPNNESARFMWYHDHAVAQTRLNAYAGLATGYIVQDAAIEGDLNSLYGIDVLGTPIVFQDKVFWDPMIDRNYDRPFGGNVRDAQPGDLWYPYIYDTGIWPIEAPGVAPVPSAVPEMFGDTMLANGVVYPFHAVDADAIHRFRLLNACNGRFLELSFEYDDGTGEPDLASGPADVDVWVIGTEGGYLHEPVQIFSGGVINPDQGAFVIGPAERYDLLVKFNNPGENVILYNVAGSPYNGVPGDGDPVFDWYVGNDDLPAPPAPGFGPNTRTIMRFDVGGSNPNGVLIPPSIPVSYIPTVDDGTTGIQMVDPSATTISTYIDPVTSKVYSFNPSADAINLTLNEQVEPLSYNPGSPAGYTGRLLPMIGRVGETSALPFGETGIYYHEPPTEFVDYDSLVIWKVYNLTGDAHPMHFHLFNVQILGRQSIAEEYSGGIPTVTGEFAAGPLPSEMGFKETVIMYPGTVTTLAVLVDHPLPEGQEVAPGHAYGRDGAGRPIVPVTSMDGTNVDCVVPPSPRLQLGFAVTGDEYVWHCHILEHEEHDMMRPLVGQ